MAKENQPDFIKYTIRQLDNMFATLSENDPWTPLVRAELDRRLKLMNTIANKK